MRIFLYLLLIIIIAFAAAPFLRPPVEHSQPVQTLPWQIEPLAGGSARVFGLILGEDHLGDAREKLGEDMELAIVARGDEAGSLEMFYSHYTAGLFKGKLVLVGALDDATLLALRNGAGKARYLDSGARKYHLRGEELQQAYQALIESITFVPAVDLDEDVVRRRFGSPRESIRVSAETVHLLYPRLGLDVMLNGGHKEVLQYVAPRDFARLRAPLLEFVSKGAGK